MASNDYSNGCMVDHLYSLGSVFHFMSIRPSAAQYGERRRMLSDNATCWYSYFGLIKSHILRRQYSLSTLDDTKDPTKHYFVLAYFWLTSFSVTNQICFLALPRLHFAFEGDDKAEMLHKEFVLLCGRHPAIACNPACGVNPSRFLRGAGGRGCF